MTKKIINNFNKKGFFIYKNFFDKKLLKEMQESIFNVSLKFIDIESKDKIKNIHDIKFHKALHKLRKKNPKDFGALFDSINNSVVVSKIVSQKNLLNLVSKLTNLPISLISYNGSKIRMDCFRDKRNILAWHQDRSYYYQNEDGNKGLVCWIPLTDVAKTRGALVLCENSHKGGFIMSKYINKNNLSPQFLVSESVVKKYKKKTCALKERDLLIFKKTTIHRSGINTSNLFRFSLQIRFHDLSDKNYLSFKRLYVYDEYLIKKMKSVRKDLAYLSSNYPR